MLTPRQLFSRTNKSILPSATSTASVACGGCVADLVQSFGGDLMGLTVAWIGDFEVVRA